MVYTVNDEFSQDDGKLNESKSTNEIELTNSSDMWDNTSQKHISKEIKYFGLTVRNIGVTKINVLIIFIT